MAASVSLRATGLLAGVASRALAGALAFACAAAGCAAPAGAAPASGSPGGGATLHPGDKIAVIVYNHPEMESEPIVDGMGFVSLPVVGQVDARGADTRRLAARIATALSRYVRRPAVDVNLIAPGSSLFFVGPIAGVLTYAPGETLVSALSQAQALATPPTTDAPAAPRIGQAQTSSSSLDLRTLRESSVDLRAVVLRRDGRDGPPMNVEAYIAAGESGPVLAPGDIIALHVRPIAVPVSGVVAHPLVAYLYRDEPLIDALRQAGGVDEANAQFRFTVVRDGAPLEVTRLSPIVSEPAREGDRIAVHEAPRVFVAGQVIKPGLIAVQGDQTLLTALYIAGGPQANGDLGRITVMHQGRQTRYDVTKQKNGVLLNNPILADGDSVFVSASHRVDFNTLFNGIIAGHSFGLL